jgi:dCTP deaminase
MAAFWSTETMHDRLPGHIEPFNSERIVNCAYELSLGFEVFITGQAQRTKRALQEGEQISIPPGQFAMLLTLETLSIPSDSIGLISIKSNFKLGGLVNVSGFHVDPGYSGRLIFSVYNAGPQNIAVTQAEPVFPLWLGTLDKATSDEYTGRRSGKSTISDWDVDRLQGDVASPQLLAQRIASVDDRLTNRIEWLKDRLSLRRQLFIALVAAVAGGLLTLASQSVFGAESSAGLQPDWLERILTSLTSNDGVGPLA